MKEVRPINVSEAPEFLELLCHSFSLDFNLALNPFYQDPFFDLNRKWALFIHGEIQSILTTIPLIFGDGKAVGIAGVTTKDSERGQGHAQELITEVLRYSQAANEGRVLLYAENTKLYERLGFYSLDSIIQGNIQYHSSDYHQNIMPFFVVKEFYNNWASQHPLRLKRDYQRWNYWSFLSKPCYSINSGYFCQEKNIIKELIINQAEQNLDLPKNLIWMGQKTIAEELQLPLSAPSKVSNLMGYGFSSCPSLFLTDQF